MTSSLLVLGAHPGGSSVTRVWRFGISNYFLCLQVMYANGAHLSPFSSFSFLLFPHVVPLLHQVVGVPDSTIQVVVGRSAWPCQEVEIAFFMAKPKLDMISER